MRNKIIIGCLLLGALSAKAQDTRLSAVEYKERVLEYSRQIKQSSEERIAMQHAIKAAKTGFFPSVDFSGSYQYRINKYDLDFGPGMSVEMDHNTYSLGATVSQPIYAGGQIYNNYKAAQVQGKITEQAEELTTDNIVYSADLNYWTAAARKGMYDVMCQYVDIVGELANVLTIRFNDGQISKTDLLQVKSRLKEAELNKSSAYKEYQIALQNLNSLMGVSEIGRTFEELKMIYDGVHRKDRLRVCFDTCHVNDAGYDLVNDYDGVFRKFDEILGLDQIAVFHINDSLNLLGAHKDRHANIGAGTIGFDPLYKVVHDERFLDVPKILETPWLCAEGETKKTIPPYKEEIARLLR